VTLEWVKGKSVDAKATNEEQERAQRITGKKYCSYEIHDIHCLYCSFIPLPSSFILASPAGRAVLRNLSPAAIFSINYNRIAALQSRSQI